MQIRGEVSYFMTQESQDAIIGKIVREHGEATKKLNLLLTKAHDIGNSLEELARKMVSDPEKVTFNGGALEYGSGPRADFDRTELEMESIERLCSEIRKLKAEIDRLQKDMERLGL